MENGKKTSLFYKIFSLLSVVRGYNILVLVIAQYLASIYIFSPKKSIPSVLFDLHLLFVVFATVCVVAGGYIINNFYDIKADKINRPYKSGLDSYVKQETILSIYFFLNIIGVISGFLVSWKAALFFVVYIFSIWFYSHKLKRYPLTGLMSASLLTILPFFVIFVYFKNFSNIIFVHAVFLFLIIMVRELIKDLENMRGAVASNYKTFPVAYGERNTKLLSIVILFLALFTVIILLNHPAISFMKYYFYLVAVSLIIIGAVLLKSSKKEEYTILHTTLKILLLIGVFSLVFIDTSLIIDRVINTLKLVN
ncbi:MAG: geranylgeranylglycerol-phosphate geranylgeranyltransferase [Flavobacteriaceae bacterium]|nr:geranylgeranylglycerol-phosphate geranylgeranyltransferase [Flavobacteriaceae bacterium]MDG1980341.1 geranylgeranylglycerol-phosphate geranylgeranyltransferase [Flavobacteriaceae bacterium]|tara:strand:+ start:1003 stop:1929 length:927 start_codon:yes stop_codon:yes gene_type:complete